MTFTTIRKFKDAIAMLAVFQGYDLKIRVSSSTRKIISVVYKECCNFNVYPS